MLTIVINGGATDWSHHDWLVRSAIVFCLSVGAAAIVLTAWSALSKFSNRFSRK